MSIATFSSVSVPILLVLAIEVVTKHLSLTYHHAILPPVPSFKMSHNSLTQHDSYVLDRIEEVRLTTFIRQCVDLTNKYQIHQIISAKFRINLFHLVLTLTVLCSQLRTSITWCFWFMMGCVAWNTLKIKSPSYVSCTLSVSVSDHSFLPDSVNSSQHGLRQDEVMKHQLALDFNMATWRVCVFNIVQIHPGWWWHQWAIDVFGITGSVIPHQTWFVSSLLYVWFCWLYLPPLQFKKKRCKWKKKFYMWPSAANTSPGGCHHDLPGHRGFTMIAPADKGFRHQCPEYRAAKSFFFSLPSVP
jgi:hypothetical protein